ncbi:hypothetical protein TrispH2_008885 [Trichoplax sp. H2]|nr:hypothetical protein TrispH2_008885 [Trichoplax sp. H2]|eukprot:RDD39299.1 hypothetical protein TrispH2_008885 [Trichoplax sp. H2]
MDGYISKSDQAFVIGNRAGYLGESDTNLPQVSLNPDIGHFTMLRSAISIIWILHMVDRKPSYLLCLQQRQDPYYYDLVFVDLLLRDSAKAIPNHYNSTALKEKIRHIEKKIPPRFICSYNFEFVDSDDSFVLINYKTRHQKNYPALVCFSQGKIFIQDKKKMKYIPPECKIDIVAI